MKTVFSCYGSFSQTEECRSCDIRNYCESFRKNDLQGALGEKRSDAELESVAALERFADLPAVYQEPGGGIGYAFHALGQFISFLVTLSPAALRLLKLKIKHPEWRAAQFARAAGITLRTLRNKEKEITLKMTTPIHFLVFIAGPMTGFPDWNRAAFYDAEERLSSWDIEAINPAGLAFIIPEYAPHEMFVDTTCALVKHCQAVVRLPGWENSTGVKRELAAAVKHGVPVFDLADPQLQQKLEALRKSLP
jgi:hypothetical protein